MAVSKHPRIQLLVDCHRRRLAEAEALEARAGLVRIAANEQLICDASRIIGKPVSVVYRHGRSAEVDGVLYEPEEP